MTTTFKAWPLANAAILLAVAFSYSANAADEKTQVTPSQTNSNAESRAEAATDRLTNREENKEMPLPGQGYSHSNLLVDKAKDKKAIDEHLKMLKEEGKIKDK